jgi:hypothetical protein
MKRIIIEVTDKQYSELVKRRGNRRNLTVFKAGLDALEGLITIPRTAVDIRSHPLDEVYVDQNTKKSASDSLEDLYTTLEERQRKERGHG